MSGRNAPRSKNGCSTCRRRKVKCGEERPVCKRCCNLRLTCEWGIPVKRGKAHAPVRHLQPAQPRWPSSVLPTAPTPVSSCTDVSNGILHPQYATPLVTLWHRQSPAAPDLTPVSPDVIFPTGWPFPPYQPSPLYRPLSDPGLTCANSLVLTEHDQKYFQYFPSSSVVFYYMKNWQWSSFRYLYEGPATTSKVIMRMILALSASDMHRNGLVVRSPGRPTAEDHGRYHYGMAVKEFRQLLETPKPQVSFMELEMIFATMFLMVAYEWQFGHCVRHLHLHLQGVRSLLETHPELFHIRDVNEVLLAMEADQPSDTVSRASFISDQFLLWMLYIDVNRRSIGTTDSLYDYVLNSDNEALHPDHLYRCARLWSRCFWGKQYPDQEVSDDMENYRGLEFLHVGYTLWHKLWKCLDDTSTHTGDELFAEMMTIRDKYSDLLLTAKFASPSSTRRTLNTIYMAVNNFYAQILFHRRLFDPLQPPSALHRQALTNILDNAHKQYTADPRLLRRLHWPLLMAIIETDDPIQREWLRERLYDMRAFHSEHMWAFEIAEDVLARQDASAGEYANLAEMLRNHQISVL
ncbi:Zn(II)2Cys6 transcription factor [Aspergillus ibericus CBS 121593]|uniref:Zn(II)2Cys6 transcription factor n=1 Tax=Aspergillus ibericus CBS 121593 TaxID=1448316 RepID=A0A395HBU7_9EURO|nr:Zn(II)2Cys6 transcription factor [Aspergillus ibericus CBS 121593]RAL05387.1 Zn(II)2Cys6 transcription factor [Aspergillus ibericus CBS 121593]